MNLTKTRIDSIDIFRALTMFFMIFVNDLWTLHGIPGWLEHAKGSEDALGFADIIFPAFLFIVGLSIPFAIEARRKKGDSDMKVLLHIGRRALALIVMGFFMMNLENTNSHILPINPEIWQILMALAFVLIWNTYPSEKVGKIPVKVLEGLGILLLVFLAIIYKGGRGDVVHWMRPGWWGILGIIGWAYLLCALIYLVAGRKLVWVVVSLLVLLLLNIQEFTPISGLPKIVIVTSAAHHVLVMAGVLASVLYLKLNEQNKVAWFITGLVILAVISLVFGFAVRPLWGISKIRATPSWAAICSGISYASFAILYYVADIKGHTNWAGIIRPAGRSTLTTYLVPYFYYAFMDLSGVRLPEYLRGGAIGLIKTALFALLIIGITRLFEKAHIRLKI